MAILATLTVMNDLHIHLGGAVPSSVLWEILCDNGLRTEFVDFMRPARNGARQIFGEP